jgi:hypothetical protein
MKKLTILIGLLACSGCVLNQPQGKILSVTSRGLYITVAATDSSTGTPKVELGLGSQTVTIIPTSTNGQTYAANFADVSQINQTINPFNTSGSESLSSGVYMTSQTNAASLTQPVVPK